MGLPVRGVACRKVASQCMHVASLAGDAMPASDALVVRQCTAFAPAKRIRCPIPTTHAPYEQSDAPFPQATAPVLALQGIVLTTIGNHGHHIAAYSIPR